MPSAENATGTFKEKILTKLSRLKGTPDSIAAGFACGAAISFTPFVGFHLLLAALSAWLIRGNLAASAIGTIVGNPWTFPFIWAAVLATGDLVLGQAHNLTESDFIHMFDTAWQALKNFDFSNFATDVWPILHPMIIGCIPFYVAVWLISYKMVKVMLEKVQRKK